MRLKAARKHPTADGISLSRTKSSRETLEEITPAADKIGVTRLADITYLDKLYLPNFSAMLPGTEDSIWVYGGKGLSKTDAKVSALMESIERYSSLGNKFTGNIITGSHSQLSGSYSYVLRPDELIESINESTNDSSILDYIVGYDLISRRNVLVPAEIALYKYTASEPAIRAFSQSHTNGLASGNTMEEAILHALCEVIERDALSIADLCSSSIAYNILERVKDQIDISAHYHNVPIEIGNNFVDDTSLFPEVDLNEIESVHIKGLVKRFMKADLSLLVKNITREDIGVTTFVASSIEWISQDYGIFAKGYGAHPDAEIALIRALTEVSQTRAANIQGARDDLLKISYNEIDMIYSRKWQFMRSTASSNSRSAKDVLRFSEIKSYTNRDILSDINHILHRLKKCKLKSSIVVDLTNPLVGIPVVRVIVPGLETFHVTSTFMGRRAMESYRKLYSKCESLGN